MKKIVFGILFLILFLNSGCTEFEQDNVRATAYFCPEDNCSLQIISAINSAEQTIDVAVYSFTLDSISNALVKANNKGVKVRVVTDYVQAASKYSEDEFLESNGVSVIKSERNGLMHNKFMVVDNKLVVTGSFNYSRSADSKNDENLVFIYNKEVAQNYSEEFNELFYVSEYYG